MKLKKLPPEFALLGYKPEPWLPEHSINLIGYMAWDLSTGWTTETLIDQIRNAAMFIRPITGPPGRISLIVSAAGLICHIVPTGFLRC